MERRPRRGAGKPGAGGERRRNRSKSSDRWLRRQRKDPFTRQASETGKGSRAHFKLEQLDQRFRLLRPGMKVLELGAAPGGWTTTWMFLLAPPRASSWVTLALAARNWPAFTVVSSL